MGSTAQNEVSLPSSPSKPVFPQEHTQPTHPARASSDVSVHRSNACPLSSGPQSTLGPSRSDSLLPFSTLSRGKLDIAASFDETPRNFNILRQFWHVWRAKTIRRQSRCNSQLDTADRHYRLIILPLTFKTWKQKWYYFAILSRRVERDRTRAILARCLTWWRYRNKLVQKQCSRIHNEVALRRMFKVWLGQVREKRLRLNSLTLSNVMERWKARTSATWDHHSTAEQWNRRRVLRQCWKEWFFRTRSAKTIQYYQIKLLQRTLAQWIFKTRQMQEKIGHAIYCAHERTIISAWATWKSAKETVHNRIAQAEIVWKHRTLLMSIQTWRRTLQLSLRCALLCNKREIGVTRRTLTMWREAT